MKKALLSVLVSALLFVATVSPVIAGIEPSPWQPQINQLEAVQNNLNSIHERVNKVIVNALDTSTPSPNVQGVVGRLSAMENQLVLIRGIVTSVIDEVLASSPDPNLPADLEPAILGVRNGSQAIADSINAVLVTPAMPSVPMELVPALEGVKDAAQAIADDAEGYLPS